MVFRCNGARADTFKVWGSVMARSKIILALPVRGSAFWERLVRELETAGLYVEVWSQITEDDYRSRKLYSRFAVWGLFPAHILLRAAWRLLFRKAVILVPTTPFYLPALLALLLRPTGVRVVHMLYDLYPDQLCLAGVVASGSLTERILASSTRFALAHAEASVFLGARLRLVAERKYGVAPRGAIIEVGGDGDLFRADLQLSNGRIRVLYSGNFGYAHDRETIVNAVDEEVARDVELMFSSSGAGYADLRQELEKAGKSHLVTLGGPLGLTEWVQVMSHAEVGLVTMRPGAEDILFPSKTYSAMLAGQAILAVCPGSSDLAETIRKARAGWVIEPGDYLGLRRALASIAADPQNVHEVRLRSQAYARQHYDMTVIAQKWTKFLSESFPEVINH